jgi:hypothetical protein
MFSTHTAAIIWYQCMKEYVLDRSACLKHKIGFKNQYLHLAYIGLHRPTWPTFGLHRPTLAKCIYWFLKPVYVFNTHRSHYLLPMYGEIRSWPQCVFKTKIGFKNQYLHLAYIGLHGLHLAYIGLHWPTFGLHWENVYIDFWSQFMFLTHTAAIICYQCMEKYVLDRSECLKHKLASKINI